MCGKPAFFTAQEEGDEYKHNDKQHNIYYASQHFAKCIISTHNYKYKTSITLRAYINNPKRITLKLKMHLIQV